MKAHDQIAAHPGIAGASARLGKCLDIFGATQEMQRAATYRQQVLNTLSPVDVATRWPQALAFYQQFQAATKTAQRADARFAAWGHDLQSSCVRRSAAQDSNYRNGVALANQFNAQRRLAAVEWNKLATRFPNLRLTPIAPSGETL